MTNPRIQVQIRTFQRRWSIDADAVRRFAATVWNALEKKLERRLPETEVCVVLLNNRQMQWYNRAYRKKDSPTDVLSFSVNEFTQEGQHFLGDLLISVEKAAEQAAAKRHTPDRELQILMLHGMLHLLGYDHEADSGEMNRLEAWLRKRVLTAGRWIRPARRRRVSARSGTRA